jgi:ABC-2 type transport system permease protein
LFHKRHIDKQLHYGFSVTSISMSRIPRSIKPLLNVSRREARRLFSIPLYMFCMIVAPVVCCIFFLTLMKSGSPTGIPVAVIDLDNSTNSRSLARNIEAFQHTKVIAHCRTFGEARRMIQRGEIYGAFLIPENFSKELQAQRQPTVSYYCNYAYFTAASLAFQDFKTMSELAGGAATQSTLQAKGVDKQHTSAFLQPIAVEKHVLGNPWVNYSVYLNNILVPAALMIFIFLTTVYSIGVELKERTAYEWIGTAGNSIFRAITGKLLPQTIIFLAIGIFCDFLMFGVMKFPCQCGMPTMLAITFLFILASQGFGVFLVGLIPHFRFAMSLASLWAIVSISMSGFTFPVTSMSPALKALSFCFPLRHYFQIYACAALNGYPLHYCLVHILMLLTLVLLPLTVLYRLKGVLLTYRYEP